MPFRSSISAEKLSQLPPEILDEIFAEIDSHVDLISLALTCRRLAGVVIPRHSEYRIIRARHRMPALWAHLAKRSDLTRHIREIQLCQRDDYSAPDRYPSTLVPSISEPDGVLETVKEEEQRIKDICVALGYMKKLEVFMWDFDSVNFIIPMSIVQEEDILRTLNKLPSLVRLVISGNLRILLPPTAELFRNVWSTTALQHISLLGDVWASPSAGASLKYLLKQTPMLKGLQLPIEAIGVADCVFPQLRQLTLFLQSGTTASMNERWNIFLENHPLLEDLWCNPSSGITVPFKGLPKLKRLATERCFVNSLRSVEQLPNLDAVHLDRFFFDEDVLSRLNFGSLQKLGIIGIHCPDELNLISNSCPSLRWLSVASSVFLELNVWLDFLSSFRNLEVFHGPGLWTAVGHDNNRMHLAIMKLVELCPRLQRLDHRKKHGKRGSYKMITIIREEREDGLHVRYEVQKSPSRSSRFDFMDSMFL